MSPEAADPATQHRIAASAEALKEARAIYGELRVVLDDLDEVMHRWLDQSREEGGIDARER